MPLAESASALPSERVVRTVLFIDVVESVRLIEQNEEDAVARWRRLVDYVGSEVLPQHGGRLVKSLGDGLMLEFASVPRAVRAAFAIHRVCKDANVGQPGPRQMLLRMGIHEGTMIADEHDIYGRDVNLAARLTTLAGPGEIVVSAAVRDKLTAMLDADIEDLGECFVKHVEHPIRAYRVGPPGPRPVIVAGTTATLRLRPTLAVIPFAARTQEPDHLLVGEVFADEIIAVLSQSTELDVISRLSTTVFRDRGAGLGEVSGALNANYILSGSYRIFGSQLNVIAELAEARSGVILWTRSLKGNVGHLLGGNDDLVDRLAADVSGSVVSRELERAQTLAFPTLDGYTLLLGAIGLMHRLSPSDFDQSRQMLQVLIDRAPRQATPQAWLAKWHVLRVQQGWSPKPERDAGHALDCTRRAIDIDTRCSLALTIDGFVHTNLLKRLDVGEQRYELALSVNPNDSLAWLLKGTLHAFKGQGEAAEQEAAQAARLSPLDPHRYFYDSLAATAALAAHHYESAVALAQRSLRMNRTHTSTLRALAIAQWQLGKTAEAQATVAELLRLDPSFTVGRFVARSPSSGFATGKLWAETLRSAGVPA